MKSKPAASQNSIPGPADAATPRAGEKLWRSLDDLADSPDFEEFLRREFPNERTETLDATTRRHFLKIMGASFALAGATATTGCLRWPVQKIHTYARRPEGRIPGNPVQYATSLEVGGAAQGVVVTSMDGRPIKVDGNPDHPGNLGSASPTIQASVLGLYDPARSRAVRQQGGGQGTVANAVAALRGSAGSRMRVLAEPSTSLGLAEVRRRFERAFPGVQWHEYEPLSRDNEVSGSHLLFGQPYRPQFELSRASVIACFDADILMEHPAALRLTRDFASGRRGTDGKMNRLYCAESRLSVTGTVADHRYPLPAREVVHVLVQVAKGLERGGVALGISDLAAALGPFPAVPTEDRRGFVQSLVADLLAERGRSVLIAGPRQPKEVHALVHALNVALGNAGQTVRYTAEPNANRDAHVDSLANLVRDINAGQVDTLLILGGNPVFDAPVDLDLGAALDRVATSAHLSLYYDETSQRCRWHLPRAHYLEEWGDGLSYEGIVTLRQPLIAPLYGGHSPAEILSLLADGEPKDGYTILKETLLPRLGNDEKRLQSAIHDGLLRDPASRAETPSIRGGWAEGLAGLGRATDGLELVLVGDYSLHDGRYANNGWLQELPDPVTKIAWDNVATLAPSTAKELGVENGDLLELKSGDRSLEVAAFVLPGQARRSITLTLGYGRDPSAFSHAGRSRVAAGVGYNLAEGAGFNAYALFTSEALRRAGVPVTVRKTGGTYPLASTQDHHIPDGRMGRLLNHETNRRTRSLARSASLAAYNADHDVFAEAGPHVPHLKSLWDEFEYDGHRWGMSIDLSACTGCSACVVACQAENNIGVVGKKETAYGREMHWIRVDRYFVGDDVDEPEVRHQPVACQQCENAPCESVCPVAATVHSEEGLNDMVYNRCIGTRYCSNNCPYKVRRFNYFNNHKHVSETEKMVYNPEVTIRNRGVMEKCTFCVQRINSTKIKARNEGREILDGEIVPACAQSCPAEAITFGDLSDPKSRVRQLHEDHRAYSMLEELNVKPRNRFLGKLTNPRERGA